MNRVTAYLLPALLAVLTAGLPLVPTARAADVGYVEDFALAKDRTAAGVLARYAVNDQITLNFRGEHVWTRENDRIAPNGQQFSVLANAFVAALAVPVVSSTGWVVVAGANVKF